jgi:excinuclease ABC subunit C
VTGPSGSQKSGSPLPADISGFADKPGVYLMKNAAGKIIYIGKAKSLRKRVRSYFTSGKDVKTRILMRHSADIETIITQNEYEALLLENNLIKQWKPRFNINLKDGKSYPVIRITNEKFPRVFRTRRIVFDGSTYYGPFPQVAQLDQYLTLIEKLFPLRKCRGILKNRETPCLYYHIGRCAAPCCGYISQEDYSRQVERIKTLLAGKTAELVHSLTRQMEQAAQDQAFEKAAMVRDQIRVIHEFSEGQQVIDDIRQARDYVGYATEENLASFVILQMRNGSLAGKKLFAAETYGREDEALHQFILQYYADVQNPPSIIYAGGKVDTDDVATYLSEVLKKKITLHIPQRGRHRKLVKLAAENASEDILARTREKQSRDDLAKLQKALEIEKLPRRIEGFDIAHLSGRDTVASMVSFLDGKPNKSGYRMFKIRSLQGKVDDYEAMRESIARRYTRVINEKREMPDLILVDGGKGQVSAAREILESLGLSSVPLAGLAKANEEIFLPGRGKPVILEEGSAALRILQHVRNESHRFATSYHKKLRDKRLDKTILEDIPGIGRKRSMTLLRVFGSLAEIMNRSPEELVKKAGMPLSSAQALIDYLKRKGFEPDSGERGAGQPEKPNSTEPGS